MKPFLRALSILVVTCVVLVAARRNKDRNFLQKKNGVLFWQSGENDAFDDDDFMQKLNDMKMDVDRQENDGPFGYGAQVRKRARIGQMDMFDEDDDEYFASDPKRGQGFFRQNEELCPRGKFGRKGCRRGQFDKSGKGRQSVKFGQGKHNGQGRYFDHDKHFGKGHRFDQAKHFGHARQFGKSRHFGLGKQFSDDKFFDADAQFDRRQKYGHSVKGRKGV